MCEKHYRMPIDVICGDCEEFICSAYVKKDHKYHKWQPIKTAAILKRRNIFELMTNTEERFLQQIDEKVQRR